MRNGHPIEPEEIMAYIDGELPVARASAAAGHMASCGECQKLAEDFRGLSRRLTEWEVEESGIKSTMPEVAVQRRRPRWVKWTGWGVGLAAAGAAVVALWIPRPQTLRFGDLAQPGVRLTALVAPDAASARPVKEVAKDARIIRTAQVALTTTQFDQTRAAIDDITHRHAGYLGQMALNTPPASGRTLNATLRIPSAQLDQTLAELRSLGHIDSESQAGQEVTSQVVDLDARLTNTQTTEQRLRDLLRQSTGKITDILTVEKELSRVREEIERMQAERKSLGDRVSFAQLDVRVTEEYKAQLHLSPNSTSGQLRNAAVEGWRNVTGGVVGLAEFLLAYGPSLLLWCALLFFPVRYLWRRWRVR
jgi:hypothetical protein